MTATSREETGHQALASALSKSRTMQSLASATIATIQRGDAQVIMPMRLTDQTASTQTDD